MSKNDKHNQDPDRPGSGHKGSLRGTKLARRARSFKDDFLEKISQMRSPNAANNRCHSPHSPKSGGAAKVPEQVVPPPKTDLAFHVKQVQYSLIHFRDVVSKNKLEMLPGNGTVILETVSSIHSAIQNFRLNEQSSLLMSASNQVYQTLARLIQLCDDVLVCGHSALEKENVEEVAMCLEDAVINLVKLAQEKIVQQQNNTNGSKSTPVSIMSNGSTLTKSITNRTSMDIPGQRTSLPDIPLTPRERQILEQTSAVPVRASHSTESILREPTPPPKPPLPGRPADIIVGTPPPLPPKRKIRSGHDCDNSPIIFSGDRTSLRSRSPDDSNSLLSASGGSLDSVLNHSREEEEIRALMDHSTEDSGIIGSDLSELLNLQATIQPYALSSNVWEEPSIIAPLAPGCVAIDTHRHSNESGFASMQSLRSSSQSFSKRASQQSYSSYNNNIATNSKSSTVQQLSTSNYKQVQQIQKSESIVQNLSLQTSASIVQNIDSITDSIHNFNQQISETKSTFISSSTTMSNLSQVSNISSISNLDGSTSGILQTHTGILEDPPALPQKTRSRRGREKRERHHSTYDNLEDNDDSSGLTTEHNSACALHLASTSNTLDVSDDNSASLRNSASPNENQPPPLPLKKKHIMAYMEMFGNCTHNPQNSDFLRHSVHTYNVLQEEWQQNESSISSQSVSISHSHTMSLSPHRHSQPVGGTSNGKPPALPPKRFRCKNSTSTTPPPLSPNVISVSPNHVETLSPAHRESASTVSPKPAHKANYQNHHPPSMITATPNHVDIKLDNKNVTAPSGSSITKASPLNDSLTSFNYAQIMPTSEPVLPIVSCPDKEIIEHVHSPLDDLDVSSHLVFKKPDEDGPDIRGGNPDALIVHATKANKNDDKGNDFMYQEAFLTTYRTFLSPLELIEKLCHRHERFACQSDTAKQRAAKEAFSLLVRVVNDLTISDLNSTLQPLMDFVYQLISSGHLTMAKPLRIKILEKYSLKQSNPAQSATLSSQLVFTSQASLLDFKSEQIAEQMTMLDARLFLKIEIPEVLVWAQEQCEERSPNLTRFTEHFNKMSYWARSRILDQDDARDREKFVAKFMKIMKHLRKINNFNSYLALLSALDSAPITRLEWPKQTTETLKEYCALIDSRSSFRAYRTALAESHPPCIPYIGLVLQDLTFVHIGNNDVLPDGAINFSKRWQQFHIVDNMKRFKRGSYKYKINDRIVAYFNNFDNYLNEEAMWQISEGIKPRGVRRNIQ